MSCENIKCVIVIDKELPLGIMANTAAILGCSLGNYINDIVGNETIDGDNFVHKGVVKIPLPILSSNKEEIKKLYNTLTENYTDEIIVIGFNDTAQKCKNYEDYIKKISLINSNQLNYLGLCIYGSKKIINKFTGCLPTLK